MSRIPTSAMPRANAPKKEEGQTEDAPRSRSSKLADKARDNPKTLLAAGAVVAGAIAAAALPMVRAAASRQKQGGKEAGGKKGKSKGNEGKKKD
jgi:hypothetical protein